MGQTSTGRCLANIVTSIYPKLLAIDVMVENPTFKAIEKTYFELENGKFTLYSLADTRTSIS